LNLSPAIALHTPLEKDCNIRKIGAGADAGISYVEEQQEREVKKKQGEVRLKV
jgi:hypothetical protein